MAGMFKTPLSTDNEDSETDSISTTSTAVSDQDEGQEFPVKELKADKYSPGRKATVYLVHWADYPIERATWEPADSFDGDKKEVIADYQYRKARGLVPEFDWRAWDRNRARDERARSERKRRREEKRRKSMRKKETAQMQTQKRLVRDVSRGIRDNNEKLESFIISDNDSALDEDGPDELLSDATTREQSPQKKKNTSRASRTVTLSEPGDESSSGVDSLMESLGEKAKAEKPKRKGKQEVKRPVGRSVPRKRALAKSISPPRERKRPTKPANNRKPQLYNKLSVRNTIQKRGRAERAPAAEELNLFKPGEGITGTHEAEKARQQKQKRKWSPLQAVNLTSTLRSGPGPRPKILTLPPKTLVKTRTGLSELSPPAKRHAGEISRETTAGNAHDFGVPATRTEAFPPPQQPTPNLLQPVPHAHHFPPAPPSPPPQIPSEPPHAWPPATAFLPTDPLLQEPAEGNSTKRVDQMDVETPSLETFKCEVEYGPSLSTMQSMGKIEFIGFGNEFLAMLKDLALGKLWVSKSLEVMYIQRMFVPTFGLPLEYVDLVPESDSDMITPFTTVLSIFHGAGVVIHKEFTLIIFQPSNDTLRSAFKTPQQKTRSLLRAVLYPPLDVEIPVPRQVAKPMHKAFDDGFDSYLPNLMTRLLGCYNDFLSKKAPTDVRSYCVTYCPDIAKPERIELECALRLLGHRVFKIHDAPEIEKVWKQKRINITVFVHQSLRYQLHLLPYVRLLHKLSNVVFRFFGMKLDRGLDPRQDYLKNVDTRFWSFGTIILLTPKFIANNEGVVSQVLAYQRAKAGSTTLCIPPRTLEKIEKFVTMGKAGDNERGRRILATMYALHDLLKTRDAIELPMDEIPVQAGELEPGEIGRGGPDAGTGAQIDHLVDRFALFHLEKCESYRKFIVCHSITEKVEGTRDLFPTIEFLGPEAAMKELSVGGSSKHAPTHPPIHPNTAAPLPPKMAATATSS